MSEWSASKGDSGGEVDLVLGAGESLELLDAEADAHLAAHDGNGRRDGTRLANYVLQ